MRQDRTLNVVIQIGGHRTQSGKTRGLQSVAKSQHARQSMEIERPLMKIAMKDTDGIPAALRSGREEEAPTSHDHLDSQFGRYDIFQHHNSMHVQTWVKDAFSGALLRGTDDK
jgi:hypothetical protein